MGSHINCDIQTESSVVRAVCFAIEKHQCLEAMAEQRSSVKIQNYAISRKYGQEDIVISRKTSIVPAEATFDHQCMDKNISITSLSQVAADQLVCVKRTNCSEECHI